MSESADNRDRLLALADTLAAGLEERAQPVVYRVAHTTDELSAIFRLRYRTVIELGWASPTDLPSGFERDKFDDHAVHIGGWHASRLAACARLVFPGTDRLLPTEEDFGVRARPPGKVVDLGRGIVARPYRDPEHRVLLGLLARCWRVIHARRLSCVCAAAPAWLIDTYRDLGFQVDIIGPARPHWGEVRHPIQIDGLDSVQRMLNQADGAEKPRRR